MKGHHNVLTLCSCMKGYFLGIYDDYYMYRMGVEAFNEEGHDVINWECLYYKLTNVIMVWMKSCI